MKISDLEQMRIRHSFMVGKLMEAIARKLPEVYKDPKGMFIIGYNHDIGYGWYDEPGNHGFLGARALEPTGFKYFQEVECHANYDKEYKSEELALLRYCDLHVDGNGNIVSIEQRVQDWANRHGPEYVTKWYAKYKPMVEEISKKFDKIFTEITLQTP